MPVIPGINKDVSLLAKDFNDRIQQPKHQRNLVLIIVCIALLLDNMLYMVIVPIIPEYVHNINMQAAKHATITSTTPSISMLPAYLANNKMSNNNNNKLTNGTKLSSSNRVAIAKNDNDDDNGDEDDDDDNGGRVVTTTSTTSKPQSFFRGRVRQNTPKLTQQTTTYVPPPPTTAKPKQPKDEESKEDVAIGFLFASKAMVQLLINPFSGAFIDRVGYDMPMCIGLTIIFLSTVTFSFGTSYALLFIARSLQGVGSAFADTSGLAMIADRFTEEGERSKALGIALAFISFGSLVAPPFGGSLYEYLGKQVPFLILAFLALVDGGMLLLVMRPHRIAMSLNQPVDESKPKGTPIWQLFMDPYIAVCSGALVMANVSLAFLEPTIAIWMRETMGATESQMGFVWLPGFIPHVLGVVFTVWMSKRFPQHQWILAAGGLALEGVSCFIIPFCTNYWAIMIPISGICFGIALVDTAVLPTLGYLVDVRHTSVYGSIYAIADISYSLAYAFGPIMAGNIMHSFGFTALNMGICFSNLLYAPVIYFLRYFYEFKPLESNELSAISNAQSAVGGGGPGFKRFNNDNNNNNFNDEYTSIDATPGMSFNQPAARPTGGYMQAASRPDSAALQSLQKYPKKSSKNPYKDTHNLIDNMEEDEQDF